MAVRKRGSGKSTSRSTVSGPTRLAGKRGSSDALVAKLEATEKQVRSEKARRSTSK